MTTWTGSTVNITYNADGQRASYSVTAAGQSQPQLVEQFSYDQGQISQVTTRGTDYPQPYTDTIFYRSDGALAELVRQGLLRGWICDTVGIESYMALV